MLKKNLQKFINFFGYEIRKKKKRANLNFDEILKNNISEKPIVFDVGANYGQSIKRFLNLFNNPEVHSFEPLKKEFLFLKEKFKKKNIHLNNLALGDKEEIRKFYIATKSDSSSFYKLNQNSKWIKTRSLENKTSVDQYVKGDESVNVTTLDHYTKLKNIEYIDLLKIDTECHEDKVLIGGKNLLENERIKAIQIEIRFDDVYQKYFNFSDIEKYLVPNNFRMVGIDLINNNLFSGLTFAADVLYFNRNYFKI